MSAPTLSDVTRSIAILDYWKKEWLEKEWLGCSVERWMENKTWQDVLDWVEERTSPSATRTAASHPVRARDRSGHLRAGLGNYLSTGTYFAPELYTDPTIEGRNAALISRGSVYANR